MKLRSLSQGAGRPDELIDGWIGLQIAQAEGQLTFLSLLDRYGPRYTGGNDHSWEVHTELWGRLERLGVRSVLDLGSGYGRLLFYGALVHGARGTGIEIVAERVQEARRASGALGLDGVVFREGDILRASWPDADCICALNPVSALERPALLRRLQRVAARRDVFVASLSILNPLLSNQPWLHLVRGGSGDPLGIQIYRSR